MELAPTIGLLCVAYTVAELARIALRSRAALRRPAPVSATPHFGAVDLGSGQPIDVTLDRRVRSVSVARERRALA